MERGSTVLVVLFEGLFFLKKKQGLVQRKLREGHPPVPSFLRTSPRRSMADNRHPDDPTSTPSVFPKMNRQTEWLFPSITL